MCLTGLKLLTNCHVVSYVRPTCPAMFYFRSSRDVIFFSILLFPRAKVSDLPSAHGALDWMTPRLRPRSCLTLCETQILCVTFSRCNRIFFSLSPQSQQHTSFSRLNGPRGGSLPCPIQLMFFFPLLVHGSQNQKGLPGPKICPHSAEKRCGAGAQIEKNRFLLKNDGPCWGGGCLLSDRG